MSTKYENIVFLQGDDYDQMLKELGDNDSHLDIAEYLSQWDYGDGYDVRDDIGAGTYDDVYLNVNGYILTVNRSMGYAGLMRKIEVEENE